MRDGKLSAYQPVVVVCSPFPSSSHETVMFVRTAQVLVPARSASPFSTRQLHSLQSSSTHLAPFSRRHIFHKTDPLHNNEPSPFNLWAQISEARPAVRYTVYAGMGLMVTAETTFWFNVMRAKYFPSAAGDEQDRADLFLQELRAAVNGYHAVWEQNHARYYAAYIWGLDYRGLDGVSDDSASC